MFVPRLIGAESAQKRSSNEDSSAPGNFSPRPSSERQRGGESAESEAGMRLSYGKPHLQRRSPSQPMNSLVEVAEFWERQEDRDGDNHVAAAVTRERSRSRSLSGAKKLAAVSRLRIVQQLRHGSDNFMQDGVDLAEARAARFKNAENPARYVTALAQCETSGQIAYGDRSGRVYLYDRASNNAELGLDENKFEFHVGKQCYTSVIDPLNSIEVTPGICSLAFLPQVNSRHLLLVANEKVPKLYKIMSITESAQQFRAVDLIGTKMIGPLTLPNRPRTVAMKQTARYAQDHEYNIHSICPLAGDAAQFATADEVSVKLWCVDHPNDSIEVLSMKSKDGEAKECIRASYNFVHAPALFFSTTSAGMVRVVDIRESLRWHDREAQLFCNPMRPEDGQYSSITAALSGCDLSPCGRYIAARDFFGGVVWDVRKCAPTSSALPKSTSASAPLCRTELQSDLRECLDALYSADLLAEKFDIKFVDSSTVFTGGFHNHCSVFDVSRIVEKETLSTVSATKFAIPTAEEMSRRGNPYIERVPHDGARGPAGPDFGSRVRFVSGLVKSTDEASETVVASGDTLTCLRLCR